MLKSLTRNLATVSFTMLNVTEDGLFKEDRLLQNFMSCATKIRFKNFSHNEALTFCRSFPGMEAKYGDLSELSNNNPGLLHRLEEFCTKLYSFM